MVKGTVKWFNNKKGYGFVLTDGGPEVFVHHTSILGDGYKTLREGEVIEYDVVDTERGKQASNVKRQEGAGGKQIPLCSPAHACARAAH